MYVSLSSIFSLFFEYGLLQRTSLEEKQTGLKSPADHHIRCFVKGRRRYGIEGRKGVLSGSFSYSASRYLGKLRLQVTSPTKES